MEPERELRSLLDLEHWAVFFFFFEDAKTKAHVLESHSLQLDCLAIMTKSQTGVTFGLPWFLVLGITPSLLSPLPS